MKPAVRRISMLALALSACAGADSGGPPSILYGEDVCDHCRMVISEERHAAGAVIDGREHRFDDPGCLRTFLAEGPPGALSTVWVHDESSVWRAAGEAWFVRDPEGATPMGSGILAFGTREAAEAAGGPGAAAARRWAELEATAPSPAK